MKKNYFTTEQIEEIAEGILKEFGDESSGFIDITELAEQLGFEVFESEFKESEILATISRSEDGDRIDVKADLSEVDKRLYISVQLARSVLGQIDDLDEKQHMIEYKRPFEGCAKASEYGARKQSEMLAEAFLMPRKLVLGLWESEGSIKLIQEGLKVPAKSAYSRLDMLGVI